MNLIVFSNCQGKFILERFIKQNKFFNNFTHYYIHYNEDDVCNFIKQYKNCSIFIYQPINNKTITNESFNEIIKNNLPKNCKVICFPSIYCELWPIFPGSGLAGHTYICGDLLLRYKNYELKKILELYDNNLLNFDLQNRFEKSINYLKNKENKYCNIKISDFILDNYKNIRLFDTQNHPNGIILSYIYKKICEYVDYKTEINEFSYKDAHIDTNCYPDSYLQNKELSINYNLVDNKAYYKKLIIKLFNNPEIVKYSYAYHVDGIRK